MDRLNIRKKSARNQLRKRTSFDKNYLVKQSNTRCINYKLEVYNNFLSTDGKYYKALFNYPKTYIPIHKYTIYEIYLLFPKKQQQPAKFNEQ